MKFTWNDIIYKQYNKLHKHWYTKISSLRCAEDRNQPQKCIRLVYENKGHIQSIAGPVLTSAVWTDKKNKNTKLFL